METCGNRGKRAKNENYLPDRKWQGKKNSRASISPSVGRERRKYCGNWQSFQLEISVFFTSVVRQQSWKSGSKIATKTEMFNPPSLFSLWTESAKNLTINNYPTRGFQIHQSVLFFFIGNGFFSIILLEHNPIIPRGNEKISITKDRNRFAGHKNHVNNESMFFMLWMLYDKRINLKFKKILELFWNEFPIYLGSKFILLLFLGHSWKSIKKMKRNMSVMTRLTDNPCFF